MSELLCKEICSHSDAAFGAAARPQKVMQGGEV